MTYHYYVSEDVKGRNRSVYDGSDVADAMAAWSKAVSEGNEYVVLEALRERE